MPPQIHLTYRERERVIKKDEEKKIKHRLRVAEWRKRNPERSKQLKREESRRWRKRNPEKKAESNRRWYQANRVHVAAYKQQRRKEARENEKRILISRLLFTLKKQRNRILKRERNQRYNLKHPENGRESRQRYYDKNRDRWLAYAKEYRHSENGRAAQKRSYDKYRKALFPAARGNYRHLLGEIGITTPEDFKAFGDLARKRLSKNLAPVSRSSTFGQKMLQIIRKVFK